METIKGYIERITYQNSENGYVIAHLKAPQFKELICIVGSMPSATPGLTVKCMGEWKQHLVHGKQFSVNSYTIESPADIVGITKYLGSGLIKGIGPSYAKRIVEMFGVDTLDIIDQQPEKLLEVQGLGKKRMETIKACWIEQRSIRDVMVFLQTHGVSPAYAQKIFKIYGQECINKVKDNPFTLAKDIHGIGFKMADSIAKKMGIEHTSFQRIDAGVEYVLSELSGDGHVCYPLDDFLKEAEIKLEVSFINIEERIESLKNDRRIELFDLIQHGKAVKFVWNTALFVAETGIAKEIKRLQNNKCNLRDVDVTKALDWAQQKLNIELAHLQIEAVKNSLTQKLHIITGGPGTGKSTITNAILSISEKITSKILLMAPTGRAAKRMGEITGKKATTIHSALEVNFKNGGFKRNRENPLDADLIIVDEASMIDTYLMYSLLKAMPDYARLIFVGDINQLPSVGPGNVLKDMISSNVLAVTTLNEIYRQAKGSRIVTNAHKINSGNFPDIQNQSDSDFFFMESETPEDVLKSILSLVSQRLPQKYSYDPFHQIQVLTPMRKGIIGADNLNTVLQEALNPNKDYLIRAGKRFANGDKIMQIRNDHKKGVYNGEIGIVKEIDTQEQQLIAEFDDKLITYEFADLDEVVLAYAVSIHKYQGSQNHCIIIPVHTTHFALLYRNLLYTGVTRAQKHLILVGTKKAISIAVRNDVVKKRFTGLTQALIGTLIPFPL